MGKPYDRLSAALHAVGATLKREKKHLVYELPNGRVFVAAKSPSDVRAEDNALSDLSAVAGVDVREKRKKAPADVRAERRRRPGRAGEAPWRPSLAPMAEALRSNGVVEQALRTELQAVKAERDALTARVTALESTWAVRGLSALAALKAKLRGTE